MRRLLHQHDHRSAGRINMTPMIDVTFLLLTFFMLASHFASAEKIDVDLPQPDNNQSVDRRFKDKIIINMLYHNQYTEPSLTLGPIVVTSVNELSDRLHELGRQNPKAEVILRADRRLSYGNVKQIMEIIAAEKLIRLQIVTQMDQP
ncbi:MAG: biopolymer transporter ExbD [Planctomycetota bacterium]|nr:MAG: biopolymer transporter ExbD [Planctomycetota bacterium]